MKTVARLLLRCGLFLSALMGTATVAHANLVFELTTGDNASRTQRLTVDSNKCPSEGPSSAYVGGVVTNTSGSTVTNATVSLNGLNGRVYLAGGQTASQYLGSMAPGQSIAVFWYTGFVCTTGPAATPTVTMISSAGTQLANLNLIIQSAISANAGGRVISSQLGAGAIVGQTIYFDADYDFGGTGPGDEYWLQPAGGGGFNAACFRMVGSEITRSNLTAAPVGLRNRLYVVQPSSQPGNNYFISVRYFFEYLCAGQSTVARPYAVQTSGQQIKYTGNFDGLGAITISFPGATNPFTITKTVNERSGFVGIGGDLEYTVTITNPSTQSAILPQIQDVLPSGMAFVSLAADSDVTSANSSSVPPAGATGTLDFIGRIGQSYALPPGGSVTLKYTATRPLIEGDFINSARGVFGSASTPTAQVTYINAILRPLTVSKVSSIYSDPVNGSGNPFAIPGSIIEYVILVTNPNAAPLDSDSIVVSDDAPSNAKMCLLDVASGSGPVLFVDGADASGLTYDYGSLSDNSDDLEFSADDGASWDYAPVLDGDGCDTAITDFRVRPAGAFAASSSFTIRVRFVVE